MEELKQDTKLVVIREASLAKIYQYLASKPFAEVSLIMKEFDQIKYANEVTKEEEKKEG